MNDSVIIDWHLSLLAVRRWCSRRRCRRPSSVSPAATCVVRPSSTSAPSAGRPSGRNRLSTWSANRRRGRPFSFLRLQLSGRRLVTCGVSFWFFSYWNQLYYDLNWPNLEILCLYHYWDAIVIVSTVCDLISGHSAEQIFFPLKTKKQLNFILFFFNCDLISGPSTSGHVWCHLLDY